MKLPQNTAIFTRIITCQNQGNSSSISLELSPKLQKSIAFRWQAILLEHPAVEDSSYIFRVLVQDLFDRLKSQPVDLIIKEHWLAFLSELALTVAGKVFKNIGSDRSKNIYLQDIQSICLGTIVNPDRFLAGFDINLSNTNDLISSLKAYAGRVIKYAAYPSIRKEFNDPNIGRSNLSLFNQYSDSIIDRALVQIGIERIKIDRDLSLCQCVREYLRQMGSRIDRLQQDDFARIGKLYQGITGDLPPPISDRLEKIGEAIRQFTSPRMLSSNLVMGESTQTIEDNITAPNPQPEEYLEIEEREQDRQNIFDICDRWLLINSKPRDRQILYLRYYFHLKQDVIAPILNINQGNISRPLRKIHLGIAQALIENLDPNLNLQTVDLIKPIVEMLQENFDRFTISQVNIGSRDELERLTQEYRKSSPNRTESKLVKRIRDILEQLWN